MYKILITTTGVFGTAFMWLVSFKLVAILFGPSGIGIYSQLRQIIQVAGIASTFGGGNSIVQGLAENYDIEYRNKFRKTIVRIIFAISILSAAFLVFFASDIAGNMLSSDTSDAILAIQIISIGIVLNAAYLYSLAILNGYQLYKSLAIAQITYPLSIVIFLSILQIIEVKNILIALPVVFVVSATFGFIISARAVVKYTTGGVKKAFLTRVETFQFMKFSMATLLATLSTSVVFLVIRARIISTLGLNQAGFFDASWTLTFNYLTLFLTACSVFYLPKLTQAKLMDAQAYCLQRVVYIVLAPVTLITYCIVFFKKELLFLLYSNQFYPAQECLQILAGAILIRSISWVLGMLMVATKDFKSLLFSEFFFNLLLLCFSYFATYYYSTINMVAWGIFLANFVYFLLIGFYVIKKNTLINLKSILWLVFLALTPVLYVFFLDHTYLGDKIWNYRLEAFMLTFIWLIILWASWALLKKLNIKDVCS